MTGTKFDSGKLAWHLLPLEELEEVLKVLMYGATVHGEENWKYLSNFKQRYTNAAFRHLVAFAKGEEADPDTGCSHLSHLSCCCLFLQWEQRQRGFQFPDLSSLIEKAKQLRAEKHPRATEVPEHG